MIKTNIKNRLLSKAIALLGLLSLIVASVAGPLSAQTLNRGYKSDTPLQKGLLVREKEGDSSKVEAVNQSSIDKLKGVVVERNDSPVTIATEEQTVFVASTGRYEALVSDENGAVKAGDYLSISSLSGVAMKAKADQSKVLGRAVAGFDGSNSIGKTTGQNNKSINLGRVQTDIAIADNPLKKEFQQNPIPKFLRNVTSSVAGEPVSSARMWMAATVFLISSFLTGMMLYGAARSSLLAIGRNPLSKTSILRGLIQVVLFAIIVFISGMFGVYLLLKL